MKNDIMVILFYFTLKIPFSTEMRLEQSEYFNKINNSNFGYRRYKTAKVGERYCGGRIFTCKIESVTSTFSY